MKLGKINNRILFLSPTVQAGWENQSFRTDFENLKTLGKGAFGIVWQAKHKKTAKIYAIKQIKKKAINTPKLIQHVKTQVRIMYLLNHPNIIKLYNHFEDQFSIYFVLQFAEKGQLYRFMMSECPQRHLSQQQSSKYIKQVVQALQFIHQNNIIHRDIKPQNILIDKDGNLKLADFGWSNFVEQIHNKRQTYCGTLDYLAPQMIQASHQHDYRVDIWSVGVLVFQLINGYSPFSYELLKANNLTEQKVKQNINNVYLKFPQTMSAQSKDLIQKLLVKEPHKRLSLIQVLNHEWIKKYNNQKHSQYGQYKQIWYQNLKKQYQKVSPIQLSNQKNFNQLFTQEQIYKYSRIESILNLKINQGIERQNIKDKRIKQLQLRIRQLQLQNQIKTQQINSLKQYKQKNIKNQINKNNHQQCYKKTQKLMETIKQQSQQIRNMHVKIIQNQRKLRKYAQL